MNRSRIFSTGLKSLNTPQRYKIGLKLVYLSEAPLDLEQPQLFFEHFHGKPAAKFEKLPQSGSARANYIAETGQEKFVITSNDNLRENETFFYFSELFSSLNLNTPKILKISDDRKMYIQEFLGSQTLSQIIEKEETSERVQKLVKQTLNKLFELQQATQDKADYSRTFEYEAYNEFPIMSDLFYFKNMFVDVLEIQYHKGALLQEFKKLVDRIQNLEPTGLMIRDFQSRNIMVNDEDQISFIDYQSAMKGPMMYDVISFLYQAKAKFPESFKKEMTDFYVSKFPLDEQVQLNLSVKPLQLIRFMQVLGAYGFRGLIQRKNHFIASISQGIENLQCFAESWEEMDEYPELHKVISELNSAQVTEKIKNILEH